MQIRTCSAQKWLKNVTEHSKGLVCKEVSSPTYRKKSIPRTYLFSFEKSQHLLMFRQCESAISIVTLPNGYKKNSVPNLAEGKIFKKISEKIENEELTIIIEFEDTYYGNMYTVSVYLLNPQEVELQIKQ